MTAWTGQTAHLSLLPLREKVAAPSGLAFGKPKDRIRAVG
jgi:hypothetical protein